MSLAWGAAGAVPIREEELNEALRRALVVRAVGGSPQREVTLDEDAVQRLAEELDSPERRAALHGSIEALRALELGPLAVAALEALLADDDFAWRCAVAGQLAAELDS